jgi:hypothetical protein
MRLWTLHPKYLDPLGLVALWREALLAQAVLLGQTRGYRNHPQLLRFREVPSPEAAIAAYLEEVFQESLARGYSFDRSRIAAAGVSGKIQVSEGQLDYEWIHLQEKLRRRNPAWLATIESVARPDPHPLFIIIAGPVADWEVGGREAHL